MKLNKSAWTQESDRDLATRLFLKKPPDLLQTPSSVYFALLSEWLEACDGDHFDCRSKNQFWPTRVIDVSGPNSSKLKILETKSWIVDVNKRGYVALSHCWGDPTSEERKVLTVSGNYKDRLNGFNLEDLPRTFQDAVQVTRELGQAFLWIDAICIIQGDHDDWFKESQKMEEVFSSAYCTIAADAAKSWAQGFLKRVAPPQFIETCESGKKMYTCNTKHDFENHIDKSELNKRAWVLQERVLSRRILHFAESHTYLACGKNVRCEDFTTLTSPRRKGYFILDPAFPDRLTRSGYWRTIEFIQHLFQQYAQAGLSKRSDKKIAISGLLRRMQKTIGSECVYGTFACFLPRLLLWRVSHTMDHKIAGTGDTEGALPSWSWMSHDHIDFFLDEHIQVPRGAVSFTKEQLQVWIFELRNCDVKDQGDQSLLFYDGGQEVGEFWFDNSAAKIEIKHCVVVGKGIKAEDAWFVLLVSAVDKGYKRLGVGRVKPLCISDDYFTGMLV